MCINLEFFWHVAQGTHQRGCLGPHFKKLCTVEIFRNRFFDSIRQRETLTVIRHLLSSPRQPTTLWPKAPGLFTTIILSWNPLKCILWYLLELSDRFIKNENSVLPILIRKNFEQKSYFCLLKTSFIFF